MLENRFHFPSQVHSWDNMTHFNKNMQIKGNLNKSKIWKFPGMLILNLKHSGIKANQI